MKKNKVGLIIGLLVALSMTVSAGYFTVDQGGPVNTVTPVERAESAVDYYDYYSVSAHTEFVEAYVSKIYLYKDSNTGDISFIVHHNIDATGSPNAKVDFDFSGLPSGAVMALSDDSGEFSLSQNPEGQWHFWYNTDGGVIGNIPADSDWSFTIVPNFYENEGSPMTKFVYVAGDGAEIELDMGEAVTISYVTGTPAPEFGSLPAVLAILLTTPAFAYLLARKREN